MDPISVEALDSLSTVIQGLLPAVADPVLPPSVSIFPLRVSAAGVGGFVGRNAAPAGDILGRRIEAQIVVTAGGKDASALQAGITSITRALVADSGALEKAGILHIKLADVGPASGGFPGGNLQVQRDLKFEVTYEFLKLPVAPEDKIQTIPIDIKLG
jgi:hypothetical protein